MPDQPQNTFGQIEPIDDTAVSQVDEDATRPVSIAPWDLSSRSRDDVLISASGDGGRGRRAWLVTAAFVAVFGLGWVGGANWYRISNIETAFNPVAQKVASSRPIPDVETKSVAKTDGPVRKTTSATASQGIHLVAAPSRTPSFVQATTNPAAAPRGLPRPPPPPPRASIWKQTPNPPAPIPPRETMVAVPETRPTTIEG